MVSKRKTLIYLVCFLMSTAIIAATISGVIKRVKLSLGTGSIGYTVLASESRSHISSILFHFSNSVTTEVRVNLITSGDTNRIFTRALTAGQDVSFVPDGEIGLLVADVIEMVSTNAQDGVTTVTLSR